MTTARGYGDMVAEMTEAELEAEISCPHRLLIARATGNGTAQIEMSWAPFDPVNLGARLAVIGITPGREQAGTALRTYRGLRLAGSRHADAAASAKATASFSGGMRKTLIRILDEIGIPGRLGIPGSGELWGAANGLVHFSSALRWPVFFKGDNYSGQVKITSREMFSKVLETTLAEEIASLPEDCLIAPLGNVASAGVAHAVKFIPGFNQARLLQRVPHPSGAARDQSSQFLGDAPRPGRVKPLNPAYRADALRLRDQVLALPV